MSDARMEVEHLNGEDFRVAFRDWIAASLPLSWRLPAFPQIVPPGDEDPQGVSQSYEWQRILNEGGWAAPAWPIEYGGRNLDIRRRLIVAEELSRARAPVPVGFHGIELLAPTILAHGTMTQRERHLPAMASGAEVWCQGYSEPDAGSDLASLRTSATLDGDAYVINGQKVWTSFGRRATWCFLLARTGTQESRHRGITFFVTPMDTPGVRWRPIVQAAGSADFGELFLDDVRVSADQIVGGEGLGWRVAMSSLGHERLLASNVAHIRVRHDAVMDVARRCRHDSVARDKLTSLGIRVHVLEILQERTLALAVREDPQFAVWAAMLKLAGSELRRALAEFAVSLLGAGAIARSEYGHPLDPSDIEAVWAHELLESRACTIYAGSSEIQRNILAERSLGLPKDRL